MRIGGMKREGKEINQRTSNTLANRLTLKGRGDQKRKKDSNDKNPERETATGGISHRVR